MEQRKARTRAALVAAAQQFVAQGRTAVPIQEITRAADLGTGSFYNHFATKEELFEAAVADALEQHGAFLDAVTTDVEDPAEVFATSFRITGRLHRRTPQLSRVILHSAAELLRSQAGLGPRVRRDIAAAREAGRFAYDDLESVMVLVAGSTLGLAERVLDHPEVDDAALTDAVTEHLLRMLGLPDDEAGQLAHASLDTDAWVEVSVGTAEPG